MQDVLECVVILETTTTSEAAERLGITTTGVRFALNDPNNPLQGVKSGGRLYVLVESLEQYRPRRYPRGVIHTTVKDETT